MKTALIIFVVIILIIFSFGLPLFFVLFGDYYKKANEKHDDIFNERFNDLKKFSDG